MRDNEMELLLRSFDEELDAGARLELARLLETSVEARAEHDRVRRLRRLVARSTMGTFAPHFADRVMALAQERDLLEEKSGRSEYPEEAKTEPGDGDTMEPIGPGDRGAKAPVGLGDRRVRAKTEKRDRRGREMSGLGQRLRTASWRRVAGFAFVAFVVTAIGLAVWLQPRTVTVPYGAAETVELTDGSIAELSSGSSLTYRNFWGRDERRVTLEGEAFFDVAEAQRPFIVETFNASISVLGTRFNVRAWSTDPFPETSVALESGRVAVSPRRPSGERLAHSADELAAEELATDALESDELTPDESPATMLRRSIETVVLEPGQATSIVRDSTAVRPPRFITLDHVVAWRTGGLAFVDQPVGSVFRTIERRFNVEVRVTDPDIQSRLLTYLNPHPGSAEDVISDICHTLDLRYRHTANGYEILPSSTP